ncbi:hypothetical protein AAOGI_38570 [Agarivorans albus]
MSLILSITGFVILNIALVLYFAKLKKNQTPKNPIILKGSMLVSTAFVLWSICSAYSGGVSAGVWTGIIFMAFYILSINITFAVFLATKNTPIGDIKVKVGDTILPFKTVNFNSESLIGKRTLLKFYRGSWCPYCSAELVMFEKLKTKLTPYGIEVMGISNDTTEQQAAHLVRDNLTHTLIPDPELNIIRQYGVEHHKALAATANDTIGLFGITMPLPWKMKHKPMSIPTSMLIDEHGKIVWIDQSEDYRIRASEEAVMGAVKANFS